MPTITPFLWFDGTAEEATLFYVSVFPNSRVKSINRQGKDGPVFSTTFELDGQDFFALNGGPQFRFTPAVSFFVNCETQGEVDRYWDTLGAGGREDQCGWLQDRYGLSWQVVPSLLPRLLGDKNPKKAPEAVLPLGERVAGAVDWLRRKGTKKNRDGMARYNVPSVRAFGVSMKDIQLLAKELGRDHALAAALWETGWYEARMLTAYVDEPERVTSAQMDRWSRDFDNWAICDTLAFALWDRTPHAWAKVEQWSAKREEFIRRTAFALLWSLSVHDKEAADARFIRGLALIEKAATDERNFVKKAVNMALRAIGKRNAGLNAAAVKTATRLAESPDDTARWVGRHALRELTSGAVKKRVGSR